MREKIYIVTVIYKDSKKQFTNFVRSLANLENCNFHLILVNNDPDISRLNEITEQYSWISIIGQGKNVGFCVGSNLGIRQALSCGATHIMLLNGDTQVDPRLLSVLKNYQNKCPKIGIVSPIIMSMQQPDVVFYGGGIINLWLGYTRHKFMGKKLQDLTIPSGPTGYASGCCMLVRREIFEKIGFLDEDYFMYFDDPDFSLRAQKNGYETHVLAEPLVYHVNSSNKLGYSSGYFFARNPFILIRKNFPAKNKIVAYLSQFVIRLPRNIFRLDDSKALTGYLKGIRDGLTRQTGPIRN